MSGTKVTDEKKVTAPELNTESEADKTNGKAEATAPAYPEGYDPIVAMEAICEEYFDVDFDNAELLKAAEAGPDTIAAFRSGLKFATLNFATKGIPKEKDDPIVFLRNVSTEDCNLSSSRYAADHAETFQNEEGDTIDIAHEQASLQRGDPLAKHGMTKLTIKGKSSGNPDGTGLACKVSLARLIKDRGGMGDNLVIEKYDPKKHNRGTGARKTLIDDPSDPTKARIKGGNFMDQKEAKKKGVAVPQGKVDKNFSQYKPAGK